MCQESIELQNWHINVSYNSSKFCIKEKGVNEFCFISDISCLKLVFYIFWESSLRLFVCVLQSATLFYKIICIFCSLCMRFACHIALACQQQHFNGIIIFENCELWWQDTWTSVKRFTLTRFLASQVLFFFWRGGCGCYLLHRKNGVQRSEPSTYLYFLCKSFPYISVSSVNTLIFLKCAVWKILYSFVVRNIVSYGRITSV
jgi:hypothetical protein